MKKIVAIGGGENGRISDGVKLPYETGEIDKEIIRLTGKDRPNFLFISHSQNIEEIEFSYYDTMQKIYGDLYDCNCDILTRNDLSCDINKAKNMVNWADIIYVGGGDTSIMIKLWKETGFQDVLYNAWCTGKVMCGISAGACCWFKSCNSDCAEEGFETVDCLGFYNHFLVPHCDEKGRKESSKEQLKENELLGISLSNCAAIEIIDNQYRILSGDGSFRKIEPYAFISYWKDGKYIIEKLSTDLVFKNFE